MYVNYNPALVLPGKGLISIFKREKTYALGPSFFQICAKQSAVFLYLEASRPCEEKEKKNKS